MAWRNIRGRNGMIPFMLLQVVNHYHSLQRKPPITAALLAANTLLYIRPTFLHPIIPPIDDVWFNPHLILKHRDLKRFFLSAMYHLSDSHLVYNMMSLLWKGVELENSMGSGEFASMVAALLGLSQTITLLLAKSLALFGYHRAYYHEYSVGFSGVLFAMKVVLNNNNSSHYTNVHGFVIPTKHAAWGELILIQLLVPGVSFLGHLGGILAGMVYLRLKPTVAPMVTGFLRRWALRSRPQTGSRRSSTTSTAGMWRCDACTFDNSGWLTACEICGKGRGDDRLSVDEIRRRRVQRFGR